MVVHGVNPIPQSFFEYNRLRIERRRAMTQLDRELDYEDFVDDFMNDYGDDFDSTDLDLEYRGYQRQWYFEDGNYRRLSDVIRNKQDYKNKVEPYIIACYIAGNRNPSWRDLDSIIRDNLTNPEINWKGIFDYMDRRIVTTPEWLEDEVDEMVKHLNPYREQLYPKVTFVGF